MSNIRSITLGGVSNILATGPGQPYEGDLPSDANVPGVYTYGGGLPQGPGAFDNVISGTNHFYGPQLGEHSITRTLPTNYKLNNACSLCAFALRNGNGAETIYINLQLNGTPVVSYSIYNNDRYITRDYNMKLPGYDNNTSGFDNYPSINKPPSDINGYTASRTDITDGLTNIDKTTEDGDTEFNQVYVRIDGVASFVYEVQLWYGSSLEYDITVPLTSSEITQLLAANFSVIDIVAIGYSGVSGLLANGYSVADLITAGASVAQLISAGTTLSQLITAGITATQLLAGGVTVTQLLAAGVVPDWNLDTDANHFVQSYVNDFIDISGSLVLRENADLHIRGNLQTSGNVMIKSPTLVADLSFNHRIFVGGDLSLNGNVTVNGDVSLNGNIIGCNFTASSIPLAAFDVTPVKSIPDYTQPSFVFEKGFSTTADVSMNASVEISKAKVDGNIEFGDGTTQTTGGTGIYAIKADYDREVVLDSFTLPSTLKKAPGDKGEQIWCSSNGQYAAISFGGWNNSNTGTGISGANGLFITNDYGATYSHTHVPHPTNGTPLYENHCSFAMSYDAKYMVCAVTGIGNAIAWTDTVIGLSSDYGVTWDSRYTNTMLNTTGTNRITSIGINHDASVIAVALAIGVHISTDKMTSWSGLNINEGQFMNTMRVVNNRIVIGTGQVSYYTIYDLAGSSLGSFAAVGTSGYAGRCSTPASMPDGSGDTIFCTSNTSGNIKKVTNINTTPVAVDISTINTTASIYGALNSIMSPSGKYVLMGQVEATIRPSFKAAQPVYYSNDFGENFTTISPRLFTNLLLYSMCISDNGHLYAYSTSRILYHASFDRFAPSTFTSLIVNNTLTAGTFSLSSDYRIKTDVSQLDETVTIDNLRPVKYLQTVVNKPHYGLIAHELQEYYPDLVVGEKDGDEWQQVKYTGLIAILINEIKRLKQELTELENMVH